MREMPNRRWTPARALAGLVACLALTIFAVEGWQVRNQFGRERRAFAAQPLSLRETEQGYRINTEFLAWARAKMVAADGNAATFWLPHHSQGPAVYQWALYELTPARATDGPVGASWVVLYGEPFAATRLDPKRWRVTVYALGYALAEAIR